MSFTNPEFLWLLPLAPLVAWWCLRKPRPAMRFSDTSAFAYRGRRAAVAEWGGPLLRGLACLFLILGCADPRRPDLQTRLPAEGVAVMLVIDVSGSMDTPDVVWEPNVPPVPRLEAARRAVKLFVRGGDAPDGTRFEPRPGDAFGVVSFAAVPQVECPLTLNHSVVLEAVDGLKPRSLIDAGTNIGDALAEAIDRIDSVKTKRKKILILLSDGEHNVFREDTQGAKQPGIDRTMRPREAAQMAASLDVKVYTIDTGGAANPADPPDIARTREEGLETLRQVATMTGGQSYTATSGKELLEAYGKIGELEKAIDAAPIYRRYYEYYAWCAAAALVLLLAAHTLERTLWRVVT